MNAVGRLGISHSYCHSLNKTYGLCCIMRATMVQYNEIWNLLRWAEKQWDYLRLTEMQWLRGSEMDWDAMTEREWDGLRCNDWEGVRWTEMIWKAMMWTETDWDALAGGGDAEPTQWQVDWGRWWRWCCGQTATAWPWWFTIVLGQMEGSPRVSWLNGPFLVNSHINHKFGEDVQISRFFPSIKKTHVR